MSKKLYGLTQKDRDAIARVVKEVRSGTGGPTRRSPALRRRSLQNSGYAIWVVATLDADMTSGGGTLATVNDYGGPPSYRANPADGSGQVTLTDQEFANNYSTGAQLRAILDDATTTPPTYEVLSDDSGGGGGGSLPDAGCGLEYADATTLQVDIETLAGAGLGFSTSASECDHLDDETSTYCCLYVDYGCGLTVTGGKLTVNVDGCLSCDSETGVLSISVGCGLLCSGGDLVVDTAALAGKGLSASSSMSDCDATGTGGAYCCLTVNIGCGLTFSGDTIIVDHDDLAGTGLTPEGTCALGVDYDPTYLTIIVGGPNDGKLSLTCDPITDVECTLEKDGTNLKLTLSLTRCSGATESNTCTLAGVETC